MQLQTKFRDEELVAIIEEAMLYMCACPGQVAAEVRRLRELFHYQQICMTNEGQVHEVHLAIARASAVAHAEMETCLESILTMEGWDRATLRMPAGLRQMRDRLAEG